MTNESTEARCKCGGSIIVHHSRMTLTCRVQYLRCNTCKAKHGTRRVVDDIHTRVALLESRLENLEKSLSDRQPIGKAESI